MRVLKSIVALALLNFTIVVSAHANSTQPYISNDPVKIGDQSYNRAQIIWDFLHIAFSDSFLTESMLEPWRAFESMSPRSNREQLKKLNLWWADYVGSDLLATKGKLHKWNSPITVSIGWSQYGQQFNEDPSRPDYATVHANLEEGKKKQRKKQRGQIKLKFRQGPGSKRRE